MDQTNQLFSSLKWTPQAQAKLKKIPFFVRSQARQRIEQIAYSTNIEVITVELVEEVRQKYGN